MVSLRSMNNRPPHPFSLVVSLLLPAIALASPLASNSPFLPASSEAARLGIQSSPNALELRGEICGPDGDSFYIFDPAKKRGIWAGLKEPGNSFVILTANAEAGSVTVQMEDGRRLDLTLVESRTGSVPGSAIATASSSSSDEAVAEIPKTEAEKRWEQRQKDGLQRRIAAANAMKAAGIGSTPNR